MKTINEMVDEYVENLGRDEPVSARLREVVTFAYLAGAKAMQFEAYGIAFNGNGSDAADCAVNIANQIRNLIPE